MLEPQGTAARSAVGSPRDPFTSRTLPPVRAAARSPRRGDRGRLLRPPELAAAVDAEPPVDPRTLVAEAETLLDEFEDGWLRDQVIGLRTYAGVLAGKSVSYADEVKACYGVRPHYTDEAVFTAAHE
jgi:hypothetical protein